MPARKVPRRPPSRPARHGRIYPGRWHAPDGGSAPFNPFAQGKAVAHASGRPCADYPADHGTSTTPIKPAAFLPWLERARTTLLRRVPAPQLPPSITLPLTGEFFAVVPGGDMAAGRKAATAQTGKTATVQVANGARRLLLVESSDQVRLYGAVDDISLCAQALRQWCRKKAARLLPPYLEQLATTEGFALAGVSVRDQSGRWGSCSRLRRGRPPQPVAQRSKLPQGAFGRPRSLEQLTTRIRNFFFHPAPARRI
jgi:Predicted metal-dependent hydrolase